MTTKYLDSNGLSYFWGKIKALIPTKTSDITNDSGFITNPNIPYCTCATAAGTKAKTTTIVSGTFTEDDLVTGAQVLVKFTNANTVASPTLKIGSTTAKSIKRYGTTAPSTSAASSWNAGSVIMFTYDGTYWQMTDFNNTTYSSMTEAEYEAGTGTSARIITPARLKAAILHWALPATTSIPSKVSDLTNDSGFISTETDPVFTASVAYGISSSDISNWNGKSELSISSDGDLDGATYTIVDGNTSYLFPSSDRFTTVNAGLLDYIQSLAVNGNLFPTTATGNMYNLVLDGDDIAYDANTSVNAKIDTIISSGGEPNAINTISVNNVNQTITNKNVNIETVIIGSTSDYTPTQVKSAIDSGKNVIITYTHSTYGNIVGYSFNYSQAYNALVSNTIAHYNNSYYLFELLGTLTNNNWSCEVTQLAQSSDIPTVPTNVSDFNNDAGYITSETDPTVPLWAKQSTKPSYTFSEIGSKPSTISGYGITDAKISSGTITLGSNSITPLTSFTETDPIFTASPAHGISSTDITNWNGKSDFSGSYNDLTDKPTIPTVNNATLTIQKNSTNVATFTANASSNVTANISVPTSASDVNALPISGGTMTSNGQIINGHITNSSTRETTPNLTPTGKRGITALLASGTMTTARPGEGTIIHCEWDTNGGWNSQLFIADNDSGNGKPFVAVRGQRSGTWTAWDRLLAQSDVTDYVIAQSQSTTSYGNGYWRWREWNSGKVEIWYHGSLTLTTSESDSNGVKRYSRWFNFPNSYSLYRCTCIVNGMQEGGWYGCGGTRDSSNTVGAEPTRAFQVMGYRIQAQPPTTPSNLNIYICGQKTI